jgi:cobalamin biosynthesis protein CbiD
MRGRTAWLAGAAGAAAAVYRKLRRAPASPVPVEDPRAEELRVRLEESRTIAEEQHEQATSAETPVDEADVESRRAAVHERARSAAEEMHGGRPDGE